MIRSLSIALVLALTAGSGVALAQTLHGTGRNDTLVGTPGADAVYAGGGDDAIYGGDGNDRLDGGSGKDHIWAGGGNDVIIGGPPGDPARSTPFGRHERVFGGAGDDVIIVRVAGSVIFGGSGDDRIDVRDRQNDCAIPGSVRRPARVAPQTVFRPLDPPHCSNVINTGPGDNFVRADDGSLDLIFCQGNRDRVVADEADRVAPECDVVRTVNRFR